MPLTLAILGFGQFGRYLTRMLSARFDVLVADPEATPEAVAALGGRLAQLDEIARASVIVLSVPIDALRGACEALREHMAAAGTAYRGLIVDVGSVKLAPIEILTDVFGGVVDGPGHVVHTHPLFGPQSAPGSMRGHTLVVCESSLSGPANPRFLRFARERLGLTVVEIDAAAHDREMAIVQGLTHFMSHALRRMDLHEGPLATPAFRHLLGVQKTLAEDSWELFVTIGAHNPFAAEMRERLRRSMDEIEERLRS